MAVDSGRDDVFRRHRAGIRVTASTAAAAGAVWRVVHQHADGSDQPLDAHRVTEADRRREGIVLT